MSGVSNLKERLAFYEQLCTVLDDLRIGAFTVDSNREITSFNRAAEMLTGRREKDVLGKYCHQVFRDEMCYGDCKFHEAVEAEQKSLSCRIQIGNGESDKRVITKIVTPLYDGNRNLLGSIEIFQDHSVFEELINRIRYDERRLKIILDNLDIGVFTTTRGGLITFFNTRAESVSGYSRKEVIGKHCSVILDGENGDDAARLKKCIEDGTPRSSNKGTLRTKDDRRLPMRANYMALFNEQGSIAGGLATIQDLSLIQQLNRAIRNRYIFSDMVGKDSSMQKIFEIVPVVAASDATLLIEGPTGTGKDLLAKVIHNMSTRSRKPMVKVNCAALPDNLLESEMFGYVRGAFTGADRDKPGRFQEADGGTIFLDEIGDLPLSLQPKLLRVLEEKEFYPLGGRKTTKVDVRIIAATNQGLEKLVEQEKFREDLLYRLNVIRLELPPLKERKGDLPLLIDHIMSQLSAVKGTDTKEISEEAMELLLNYDYPGNIRELENILEHALILCQDNAIERKHLPLFLQKGLCLGNDREDRATDLLKLHQDAERHRILQTLERNHWHRGKTARHLDMDRTTLWRKMRKYDLSH